ARRLRDAKDAGRLDRQRLTHDRVVRGDPEKLARLNDIAARDGAARGDRDVIAGLNVVLHRLCVRPDVRAATGVTDARRLRAQPLRRLLARVLVEPAPVDRLRAEVQPALDFEPVDIEADAVLDDRPLLAFEV